MNEFWSKGPFILSHRGDNTIFPENSLGAFASAMAKGADGIEFDVHLSADGVPVVMHDKSLKKMVGLNELIGTVLSEKLAGMPLLDIERKKTKELIPTLKAVLASLPNNAVVNVELKQYAPHESPFFIQAVCDIIASEHHRLHLIISSFERKLIDEYRKMDANITLAYLYDFFEWRQALSDMKIALSKGIDTFHLPHAFRDVKLISAAKENQLHIMFWNVKDVPTASKLLAAGADGIIVDNLESILTASLRA